MSALVPMRLLAMRHGAAGTAASDRARRLTAEGRTQVRGVAEQLRDELGAAPERLWTSPYPRAHETALLVGEVLGVAPEAMEELTAGQPAAAGLLPLLRALAPAARQLMIVGHAPDLANLVTDATGAPRVSLGTGSVAQLEGERLEVGALRLIRIWG